MNLLGYYLQTNYQTTTTYSTNLFLIRKNLYNFVHPKTTYAKQ